MSFVDKVAVTATAGNGGNGKISFRREKFISKGGPDGGDGGNGGDIVLLASNNQNTLAAFRYKKELRADSGQPGDYRRMHGRSAKDLIVAVPVGTVATNAEGKIIADLVEDGQQAVVAKGGRGGFGNAHFVSSRRQAPDFAEKGEPGESLELQLELKMIADVGLVGLPNAGKSTLLSKLSNARPEVADYPFTTLTPNLGVADVDKDTSVLLADIPGLIEGAAEGKGLGHDFLRHIERTAVILHLIDAYNEDVAHTYQTVRAELEAYQPELIKRPEIIALNKVEGLDQEIIDDLIAQLKQVVQGESPIFSISAQSGQGLPQLLFAVKDEVQTVRSQPLAEAEAPGVPVITLTDTSDQWQVAKQGKIFVVTGQKIEQFARRTDFGNEQGVQRLRDIMRRAGIMHELRRQGVEPEQTIRVGKAGEFTY
ncbi:MAG TPA: GTPase ObgE [Candidatus Saccharimonadales bacterium]|jgi:GTP-binding protein|nr:GTPase ObgE [Candidatus Saccharimonadales bacterium]